MASHRRVAGFGALRDVASAVLLLTGLAALAASAAQAGPVASAAPGAFGRVLLPVDGWRWQRLPAPPGAGPTGLRAVAAPVRGGRIAVGHGSGVSVGADARSLRHAARVDGVRDLLFDRAGRLWIAALDGLHRLSPDGRLAHLAPAPGEQASRVHRIAEAEGVLAVATDAGVYASLDGRSFRRVGDGLPSAPAAALALRGLDLAPAAGRFAGAPPEEGTAVELWVLVRGAPWSLRLVVQAGRLRAGDAARHTLAGAPSGVAPVDLALGLPGGVDVAVVWPRHVASRVGGAWRVRRPVLPPGATIRRIGGAAGRLWLATDRGLLEAPAIGGPWRRTASPAGTSPTWAFVPVAGGEVLAVGEAGLLRGAPVLRAATPPAASPPPRAAVAPEPAIGAVHRASLRYLGLGPERMRGLRGGLAARGWLPQVALRLVAARDEGRGRDRDQSFISGDTRHLVDRDRDESTELEGSVTLTWDFTELAFPGDAVDLSREERQVISLRDDVLDEVNQIYFERRSVLSELARAREQDPAAALRLRLRAEELAAGLDAWTGGWFSEQRRLRAGGAHSR